MAMTDQDRAARAAHGLAAAAAPDVAAAVEGWLARLAHERRLSAKTLEAYARDLSVVLVRLTDHLGKRPTLSDLAALTPADVRAV
ncbi:site-specific integrase, partial [Xanthobacter autotrophicus]|uniref:site-specific integrase n=1 Tax=Xanthobacter autotrophicus TaxID=280 RepID=UPI001E3F5F7A